MDTLDSPITPSTVSRNCCPGTSALFLLTFSWTPSNSAHRERLRMREVGRKVRVTPATLCGTGLYGDRAISIIPHVGMRHIHQRIRELCSKLAMANDSEIEAILSELRAVTQQHEQFVKLCAGNGLTAPTHHREASREEGEHRLFLVAPSRVKNKGWRPTSLLQ